MSGETTAEPRLMPGLSAIMPAYDALLLDAWGVLHDGNALFAGVEQCLRELRRLGTPVIVLTNAGRREHDLCLEMSAIGLAREHYHDLVSSGELAWQALRDRSDPEHAALGSRCYYLGQQRSTSLLRGLDLDLQDRVDTAGFIIATGPAQVNAGVGGHAALLERAAAMELTMVCANPDREVVRGGRVCIAAGALAERYESRHGARVIWHGKPWPAIYARALDRLAPIDRRRVLVVGDALATDIAGARRQGLDSALVCAGIHHRELESGQPDAPDRLYRRHGVQPDFLLPRFAW